MSSSSSESERSDTDNVTQTKLPVNSREIYMKAYENFMAWRNERGNENISEDLLLSYFKDFAKTKQPSSLWSLYSKLKATLHNNNSVSIDTYDKLTAYIKQINIGYKSKKSKVFTRSEIETFLREAPDNDYLVLKVVLIFGVQGACRGGELVNIRVDDVEKHSEQLLLVKVKDNHKGERSFVIRDEYKDIVEKYMALRPRDAGTDRFFIRYQNGRCIKQVIGRNRIATMPRQIAAILNLPNPKLYTGHCFRRTASALSGGIQLELPSLRRNEQVKSDAGTKLFTAEPRGTEGAVELNTIVNTGPTPEPMVTIPKVEIPVGSPAWCSSPSLSPSPPLSMFEQQDRDLSPPLSMSEQQDRDLSPPLSMSEQQDRDLSPPPRKKERIHDLQTGRIKITESINNTSDTKTVSVPTKNITIIFENCKNVSNININF